MVISTNSCDAIGHLSARAAKDDARILAFGKTCCNSSAKIVRSLVFLIPYMDLDIYTQKRTRKIFSALDLTLGQ